MKQFIIGSSSLPSGVFEDGEQRKLKRGKSAKAAPGAVASSIKRRKSQMESEYPHESMTGDDVMSGQLAASEA